MVSAGVAFSLLILLNISSYDWNYLSCKEKDDNCCQMAQYGSTETMEFSDSLKVSMSEKKP